MRRYSAALIDTGNGIVRACPDSAAVICSICRGGIIFALFYFKRYKAFENFIKSDAEKIRWEYDDALYESFIGELNAIQKKASKKKFFILLAIIIVLSVILFFLLSEESKMLAVAFGVFFAVTAVIFVLIAPNSFRLRATNKPYCSIISEDQAYMMGRGMFTA